MTLNSIVHEKGLRPGERFPISPALEAHVPGVRRRFHFDRGCIDLGESLCRLLQGDDPVCVFRLYNDASSVHFDADDFHPGRGVEPPLAQRLDHALGRLVSHVRHVPPQSDVPLGVVAVVVGKSPDPASGRQQQIPAVGGVRASLQKGDDAVVDLDPRVPLAALQQFLRAVIEVGEPVWMVEDGKTGYLVPPESPQELAEAIVNYFREGNVEEFRKNVKK